MNINKIATLIRTKRKENGMTQEELAKKLNVTEKAISRWETARGTPDISLLIPLSKNLNISVSELLNGKEDKNEEKNIKEIINYIDITNKSKNKNYIIFPVLLYIIELILYLWYLRVEYDSSDLITISLSGEIVLFLIFSLLIILSNKLLANYYDKLEDKIKISKITYIIILVLYTITFLNLTIFGRNTGFNEINIIPFKTIMEYLKFFDTRTFLINIVGNIIILMPIEYFLLKIFKINKFSINLFISFMISLFIEILQYITKCGILDIDDIILNVIGMNIFYYLYNLIIRKNIKIKLKYFITSVISFLITIIIFDYNNWYILGNIPSIKELFCLIIGFSFIEVFLLLLVKRISKRK